MYKEEEKCGQYLSYDCNKNYLHINARQGHVEKYCMVATETFPKLQNAFIFGIYNETIKDKGVCIFSNMY